MRGGNAVIHPEGFTDEKANTIFPMSIEKTHATGPGWFKTQPAVDMKPKTPHAYQKQEERIAKKLKRRAMLRSQGIYKS